MTQKNNLNQLLLCSDFSSDVSLLAELTPQLNAHIDVAPSAVDFCKKIAKCNSDGNLAAAFIDVSTAVQLQKFEYELQAQLGTALALQVRKKIHYISDLPLSHNREVLLSPYFSYFFERRPYAFRQAAKVYIQCLKPASEWAQGDALNWDLVKENIGKPFSVEWFLQFKSTYELMMNGIGKAGFIIDDEYLQVLVQSDKTSPRDVPIDQFLSLGVSVLLFKAKIVLFSPIYSEGIDVKKSLRLLKIE